MKKNLLFLFALICSMSLFTACNNDDDDDLSPYAGDYKEASLKLSIGEVPMIGKEVTLNGDKMVLKGVVPGETALEIPVTIKSGAIEGSSVTDAREVTVTGAIDANKVMSLTVGLKLKNKVIGKWDLVPFTEEYDDEAWESVVTSTPISVKAVSPDGKVPFIGGMDIPTAKFESFMSGVLGAYAQVLKDITFREDGFIVATVKGTNGAADTTSPVGVAQYYVKDNMIYVIANLSSIMGVTRANAGMSDIEKVLTMLTTTGMPLVLEVKDNALHAYVTKEMMSPFVGLIEMLLPLLSDMEGMEDIAGLLNMYFPMFKGAFDKCTEFNIGLKLEK